MRRPKKMIIILAGLVAALFCWGPGASAQPFGLGSAQQQREPRMEVLSSPNGRYVFGQISDSGKDQFMLDTATGRLWRIAESGGIGLFLRAVPYRDAKGTCTPIPQDASTCADEEGEKK